MNVNPVRDHFPDLRRRPRPAAADRVTDQAVTRTRPPGDPWGFF